MAAWRGPFDDHAHEPRRWVDAPVYPGLAASSGAGRFLHSQCDQELFNAEYLRSNKASGHKNLRCFPHCCGGHNPKSFCGSGLVVESALPHAQIALGRFEELVRSPHASSSSPDAKLEANQLENESGDASGDAKSPGLVLEGRVYSRRELFRELKSSENPFGMWFKGTAVLSATDMPRFHVNGNRASWHYGWQSSRLNCKNLHVFKVYFFQSSSTDADADMLQCVGSVSSPPFRISSSRKARKTFKSSPSMQSLNDSVSDDQLSIPQSSPRAEDDRLSVDSFDGQDPVVGRGNISQLHAQRSRSSFDLGLGFGFGADAKSGPTSSGHSVMSHQLARGDILPSLSSRLSRTSTNADAFGPRHYRGQPDRKRLTRSASLQTDYYSSSSALGPFNSNSPPHLLTRQPRARTYQGEENPPRSRSIMMSMDSLLNSPPTATQQLSNQFPQAPDIRPSLSAITVPQLTLSHLHAPVTTPVADMMQLQLGTPRVLPRTLSGSSAISSSEFAVLRPPLSTSSRNLTPRVKRKRHRSSDSGTASDNQLSGSTWNEGPLLEEIAPDGDWDLVAQAHALGVVLAVASVVKLGEQRNSPSGFYEVVDNRTDETMVITPVSRPGLFAMCDAIVNALSQLIHGSSFLLDMRTKMQDLARASPPTNRTSDHEDDPCKAVLDCYEAVIAFAVPRVEEQVATVLALPNTRVSSPSPLVELIRLGEQELVRERWWRGMVLFDHENDDFPFMENFRSYFKAVEATMVDEPLFLPNREGQPASLTGDWRLVKPSRTDTDCPVPCPLSALTSIPWLLQQLHLFSWKLLRVLETESTLAFSHANSLVSAVSPFKSDLGLHEPTICLPVDNFPFAFTNRNLMAAYRTWRENRNNSIAVQVLQWPSASQCRILATPTSADRRQLTRTRLTIYLSLASPTTLEMRLVLENSTTEDAKLCAMAFATPNEADMTEYFKAPASWEVTAQTNLLYERL